MPGDRTSDSVHFESKDEERFFMPPSLIFLFLVGACQFHGNAGVAGACAYSTQVYTHTPTHTFF